MLARQNGNSGTNTVVANGNQIGRIDFQGNDGTNMETAAIIGAEIDGTPGNDDMPGRLVFKTTQDGAKAATERFRITSTGNVGWKNQSVFQRKSGGFKGLGSGVTDDTTICSDFGNNDLIRVCWAINWNAGDGGAWGEAVIWKQYEGTVRVRYLTNTASSPVASVTFPTSGSTVDLRITTNAGINGYYMFDVQTHGCTPASF